MGERHAARVTGIDWAHLEVVLVIVTPGIGRLIWAATTAGIGQTPGSAVARA